MKTNIIVKLVLLLLLSVTLNGCYGGRYNRFSQPRITEEYGKQTETVIDQYGKKSTRVIEQIHIKKDPPPEPKYYRDRYYEGPHYRSGTPIIRFQFGNRHHRDNHGHPHGHHGGWR